LNPRVKELLERCLEKIPKKRWQAIGDIRAEIEKLIVTPLSVAVAPVVSTQPLWKRAAAPLAAAMVTGLAAGYGAWTMKPEPPRPLAATTARRYGPPTASPWRFSPIGKATTRYSCSARTDQQHPASEQTGPGPGSRAAIVVARRCPPALQRAERQRIHTVADDNERP